MPGPKTISSSLFQVIPRPRDASASWMGVPPPVLTIRNVPPAKNASDDPSGDHAGGSLTPSVPLTGCASSAFVSRIQTLRTPLRVAMKASRRPSGDSASAGVRSRTPPPKAAPSGGSRTNWRAPCELVSAGQNLVSVKPPARTTRTPAATSNPRDDKPGCRRPVGMPTGVSDRSIRASAISRRRSRGSLSRQRRSRRPRSGGVSGGRAAKSGLSFRTLARTSVLLSPVNGRDPVSIS